MGSCGVTISAMHKRSFVLSADQKLWLELEARRLGIKVNELLRRIIDKARKA